jgi:cytochrome c2
MGRWTVWRYVAAAFLCAALPVNAVAADGNWRDGRKIFRKCESCHSFKPNEHRFGPSLAGVFGRKAGTAPDYKYSPGMNAAREKGVVWTPETLETFLTKPKAFIKGTRMWFPGLKRAADRANVIAYVKRRSLRRR